MADFSGIRPWMRGLASKISASGTTLGPGELLVSDQGDVYGGKGTAINTLSRLARLADVLAIPKGDKGDAGTGFSLLPTENPNSYVLAEVDPSTGRMSRYVDSTGATFIKLHPNVALPGAQLDAATQTRMLPAGNGAQFASVPVEATTDLLPITDAAGKIIFRFDRDGYTVPSKFKAPVGSIDVASLTPTVLGMMPQAVGPETGYAFAIADSAGRVAFGLRPDGTPVGKFPSPVDPPSVNTSYVADVVTDANGYSQIRSHQRSNGQVTRLTSSASNKTRPRLTSDNLVIYLDDQGQSAGTPVAMYVSATGGTAWPVLPVSVWAAPGDSLTAGGWPEILSAMLGVTVENWGIGGQTAAQIAARAMGTPATVTLSGNQIPAGSTSPIAATTSVVLVRSGDVGAFTPGPGAHNSFGVTIAGVHGTLAVDGSNVTTFTPDTAPAAAVPVPSGTTVFTDMGVGMQPKGLLPWMGRNNLGPSPAENDNVTLIQSVLAYNKPLQKRFLTMTILPSTDDTATVKGYVTAFSNAIMAAFPDNYVDIATYLRSDQAFTDAGVTKTSQDATDIANGNTPTSFRATGDGLHLNATGNRLVALALFRKMQSKGWA